MDFVEFNKQQQIKMLEHFNVTFQVFANSPELQKQVAFVEEHEKLFNDLADLPLDEAVEEILKYYNAFNKLPTFDKQAATLTAILSMPAASAPSLLQNIAFFLFALVILNQKD